MLKEAKWNKSFNPFWYVWLTVALIVCSKGYVDWWVFWLFILHDVEMTFKKW